MKFRELKPDEIQCRVQSVNKSGTGFSLLLYKDARCDMDILDETVSPLNWKREHSRDNANCTVSIWDKEKEQWVSKEDTGAESYTEKEKGLASDSFKRACFNWGIGRELYTAPFIWINAKNGETYVSGKDNKGNPKYSVSYQVKFFVDHIKTIDGKIEELRIIDKEADIRFSYGILNERAKEIDDGKEWLDETKEKHWKNAEEKIKSGEKTPSDLREVYKVSKANYEYFETLYRENN